MKNHVLKIEPNSEAERYFINTLIPICEDGVKCRLGNIYGMPWNEYEITDNDYYRCRALLKESN